MTCEHCGAPLPPDAKNCPVCGRALDLVPPEVEQEIAAAVEKAQAILERQTQPSQKAPDGGESTEAELSPQETSAGEESPEAELSLEEPTPEAGPAVPEKAVPEDAALPRQVDPPLSSPAAVPPLPPEPQSIPEEGQGEPIPGPEGPAPEEAEPQPEDPSDEGPVYARKRPRRGAARSGNAPAEGDPSVPSTWHYFLMQLVLGLPIIGFILSIIWGLEEGGPLHRKNFARANILYSLLKLLFQLVIVGVVISLLSTLMGLLMSYGYYYDPYYGYDPYYDDFFGWYEDYGSYGEPPYYYNSAGHSSSWQGDAALPTEGMESV